ncbi:Protein maternal effect lethal 26 [Halotydeus destructor]|nr:Protein maternal effect lethal 26 [Halotydeus destructor]
MDDTVSRELTGQLKLFNSIDGAFNDFQIQAVGGSVEVNKNILAVKWKYFEAMMESKRVEYVKNVWIVEDVEVEIMKDIVGYVYCDAITLDDKNHAVKLLEAGHRYLLVDLVDACSKYLMAEINPGTVLSLLVLGDKYSLANLRDQCMLFIPKAVVGKDLKDLNGYVEYVNYFNHSKLTELCFEKTARRLMYMSKSSTKSPKESDHKPLLNWSCSGDGNAI